MASNRATNISWHEASITKKDREQQNKHKSTIIWLTGLSGSGKSTLAHEVEKHLYGLGCKTYVLDGDNIRHGLNKNLGFSPQDRTENIRRIGEVAKLFVEAGMIVFTAFISPYRKDRDAVRALVGEREFIEVYLNTPIEECKKRDPKGLYEKAIKGEIAEFTGISAPYEPPVNPEIEIDTARYTLAESRDMVINYLKTHGVLDERGTF